MNYLNTLKTTETNLFGLVGFDKPLFDLLTPPPGAYERICYCEALHSVGSSMDWLEQCVNGQKRLPNAMIFNIELLRASGLDQLSRLNSDDRISTVPVIVFGEVRDHEEKLNLLTSGVDDIYEEKPSGKELFERIEFIAGTKAALRASKKETGNSEVSNDYKIPTGKRIFDIVFASGAILALSPLMLLIALAIKLESKGPVIYRSKRVGSGYNVFYFLKFRSMVQDADAKLKNLQHLNHYGAENGNNAFFKLKSDPRITRIGKIIRKTSLDELPQLFNVLKGEMSIIGNRPLPLYEAVEMTRADWSKRFWAPAGITGLWQTCGAGKDNLSVEERVALDLEYAANCSMVMDAKILLRTLPAMLQKED